MLQSCAIKTIPTNYVDEPATFARPNVKAVFMDGTNNKSHPAEKVNKNTHVKTTHGLVQPGIRTMYIEGVGAGGKIIGLAIGTGTKARVTRAYRFLSEHYTDGDSIYLFGFSRGANQCRILGNLLLTAGMLNLDSLKTDAAKMRVVKRAYKHYRKKGLDAEGRRAGIAKYVKRYNDKHGTDSIMYHTRGPVQIEAMGLWETVEAFNIIDRKQTIIPRRDHLNQVENVNRLYHAVSLDDNRALTYTPILASTAIHTIAGGRNKDSVVQEVWFNGSHRDVGGGHKKDANLHNNSLKWMLTKMAPHQLFEKIELADHTMGEANNMNKGFLKIPFTRRNRSIDRYYLQVLAVDSTARIKVHESVIKRLEAGEIATFKKFRRWDDWFRLPLFSSCFVENGKGRYRFVEGCKYVEMVKD